MIGNVRYLPRKLRKWYILYLICLILIYGWLLFTDQSAVLAVAILLVLLQSNLHLCGIQKILFRQCSGCLSALWHLDATFRASVISFHLFVSKVNRRS